MITLAIIVLLLGVGGGVYSKSSRFGGDPTDTHDPGSPENTEATDADIDDPDKLIPEPIPTTQNMSLTYEDIEIGNRLGSGGNADVFKAEATNKTGQPTLAVKEPRESGTIDNTVVDEVIAEAETWKQLDGHDHIVSVIDYGETPVPWIGMEYMDGGDLSQYLGKMDFEQKRWTAVVITNAVHHAHSNGVAHFDIKPKNILFRLVDEEWDAPKIADWGLSKELLKHSKSVEGLTPEYAAPEQFDTGEFGQTDKRTDVYQLGAVFYELFTGRPPFEGQTFEVIDQIKEDQPTPPSEVAEDLPPAIDDILLKALATDKEDRYESVLSLRDDLEDL